jgi:nucleotide-binding universal stress UspA family protein
MKILIAYDGSGYSHNALDDLRRAGLPDKADVLLISVSEVWLSPPTEQVSDDVCLDNDVLEYFNKHSEQMDRNFTESKTVLIDAKNELQRHFPNWTITTEAVAGSPARMILQRSTAFAPDLVVVGSRGLSSDRGSGLGSVSQNVLSYSQFSVRIGRRSFGNDVGQLRIAICIDGSACSLEAVKTAAQRDWQGNPEFGLFVVTDPVIALIPGRVLQVIPGVPEGRMKGEETWVTALAKKALRILEDSGRTASVHIYSGNPRIMLVDASKEWKANAIFVGMHSQQSHLLGCVASAVAARASCSVEVVLKATD